MKPLRLVLLRGIPLRSILSRSEGTRIVLCRLPGRRRWETFTLACYACKLVTWSEFAADPTCSRDRLCDGRTCHCEGIGSTSSLLPVATERWLKRMMRSFSRDVKNQSGRYHHGTVGSLQGLHKKAPPSYTWRLAYRQSESSNCTSTMVAHNDNGSAIEHRHQPIEFETIQTSKMHPFCPSANWTVSSYSGFSQCSRSQRLLGNSIGSWCSPLSLQYFINSPFNNLATC